MQTLRVSRNIIPVSEFKAKAAEWLRRLGESAEPLVITLNVKAAGVRGWRGMSNPAKRFPRDTAPDEE